MTTEQKVAKTIAVMRSHGMTTVEAINAIASMRLGLKELAEGRRIPWNQVKAELGLDNDHTN